MEKFILTRKGQFKPHKCSSNQCKTAGHRAYQYEIAITCDNKLDKEGFIIDHMDIDKAIQNMGLTGSCEQMCVFIKLHLSIILLKHGIVLRKIHIKIKPKLQKPVAYIQYIWK